MTYPVAQDAGSRAARQYRHEANHHREYLAAIPADVPEGPDARRQWWHELAIELLERAADAETPCAPRPMGTSGHQA